MGDHPHGTDPKFLSESQSKHGGPMHVGGTGPEHPDYKQYSSGPSPSLHHLNVHPTYKGYDDRDELHDLTHHLLNQPELPPTDEDNDRFAELVNHPIHGPRIERAAHRAFGGTIQGVQGYDEEWRAHLHQLDKDIHRERMSGREPQKSWPFPTGDRTYSTARRGATSVVDKEGNKLP